MVGSGFEAGCGRIWVSECVVNRVGRGGGVNNTLAQPDSHPHRLQAFKMAALGPDRNVTYFLLFLLLGLVEMCPYFLFLLLLTLIGMFCRSQRCGTCFHSHPQALRFLQYKL
jgi:hypothetical protein